MGFRIWRVFSGPLAVLFAAGCYELKYLLEPMDGLDPDCYTKGCPEEPRNWAKHLKEMPRRRLTQEQIETFRTDGVVHVPKVVTDEITLSMLDTFTGPGQQVTWNLNGVLKGFVRDSTIGELAASAVNASGMRLIANAVFRQIASPVPHKLRPPPPAGGVHVDVDSSPGYLMPLVTVWLALTDANEAIEFLGGSHLANLGYDCPYGSNLTLEDKCMKRLQGACNGIRTFKNIKTGDALVFYSQTYHWAVLVPWTHGRTALSFRFIADGVPLHHADASMWLGWASRMPGWCRDLGECPAFPRVFPREEATVDSAWPLVPRRADSRALTQQLYDKLGMLTPPSSCSGYAKPKTSHFEL